MGLIGCSYLVSKLGWSCVCVLVFFFAYDLMYSLSSHHQLRGTYLSNKPAPSPFLNFYDTRSRSFRQGGLMYAADPYANLNLFPVIKERS